MKRYIGILLLALVLAHGFGMVSFAGEWKQDDKGWWYQEDDGSYPANAWKQINEKWYYLRMDI